MTLRRTRVKAQDMKTGEFAYLDQLVQDGYYPHLWVLPKNVDPAQPVGKSLKLPLMPIFNYSPPNITDVNRINLTGQIDYLTGMAVGTPCAVSAVGPVTAMVI